MNLSSRTEYALLALVYLARHTDEGFISVNTIAEAQGIPAKFLEQIMLVLKLAKYLRSSKGKRGGFCLAKPASKITLAEIIRLFDGALAPSESVSRYFYEPTPIERERKILKVFREVRNMVAKKLENTTVADVC